ncbi:ABC transporter ATP-binding protein [Carnobacterium divergens]|uniref:ABC transporter ATP-binding protein n=1 Tax=Carnobacterium divergens TaxID=2748 RepID=A0A7Z8G4X0_CARDV|nr:ABC transporter ATP-binding protein [Carnobacterium divergens]TFI73958.1 ABC transporter ATP-binding protein [Carnobacterium divergens]TFI77928.1 ABC transporter ATP-binding protein [Carnobacterium divergens]TFI84769.1 ABC transporter ATP-binding protein [Carnobacterium divergens]TFI96808.1 ABC transporter ATP-binding protein [Carnobacterium divergens]TFJ12755.1 ABC transporter ATP-binding protein [Carnobacterium divergens]
MKLRVESISFAYSKKKIIEELSFQVDKGEFVTILGPSGCGKSTILKLLTGLKQKQNGRILVDGKAVEGLSLKFSYMPQEDLLLEWETVLQNVCLYQRIHKEKYKQEEVMQQLEAFGLKGYENAYPSELSGGMRQRVAFLRTVRCDADILLLDEPFGALDVITRGEMQEWLRTLRQTVNKTVLLVTHDIDEALYLSDRILIVGGSPSKIRKEFNSETSNDARKEGTENLALRAEIYHNLKRR